MTLKIGGRIRHKLHGDGTITGKVGNSYHVKLDKPAAGYGGKLFDTANWHRSEFQTVEEAEKKRLQRNAKANQRARAKRAAPKANEAPEASGNKHNTANDWTADLPADLRRKVQTSIDRLLLINRGKTTAGVIEMGEILTDLQDQLGHGHWLPFLKAAGIQRKSSSRFQSAFATFGGKRDTVTHLNPGLVYKLCQSANAEIKDWVLASESRSKPPISRSDCPCLTHPTTPTCNRQPSK